ncbi:MAG: DUF624 domain-containing protein [Clostridiales bacterium]|nr:DUF624 domain-containing protein [Clostridiales bacterium]
MKLLQVNLLYALITLPIYGWLLSVVNAHAAQSGGIVTLLGPLLLYFAMDWPAPVLVALVGISAVLLGPATAAMTSAVLDCAWDRPGMFWPTFWEGWRVNWKQSLPIGLLDVFACFATIYYMVDGDAVFGSLGGAVKLLWLGLALVYCLIRVYIYPIMVTVELPFGALLKNSLILALMKPWRPLLVVAVAAVLCGLCIVADIVLVPCFLYSFIAFTAAFLTQSPITGYLLCPEGGEAD